MGKHGGRGGKEFTHKHVKKGTGDPAKVKATYDAIVKANQAAMDAIRRRLGL